MEEFNMNEENCLGCLHCKVSSLSTETYKLYYCAQTLQKEKRSEAYWLEKPICEKFTDMSE